MVETYQQLIDVGKTLGWAINDIAANSTCECGFEFCQYSPAGEDFFFCAQAEDLIGIIRDVVEYAREFDVDEHVRSVMDMRGAPRLSVLVDDAREIADMIQELADALINYDASDEDSKGVLTAWK